MPVFTYRALDRSGKSSTGTIPAESKSNAFDQLAARGLSPVSVMEQGGKANGNGRLSRLFGNGQAAALPTPSRPGASVSAAPAGPPPAQTKVSQAALESFTREMANLLAAGLPLSRALSLL